MFVLSSARKKTKYGVVMADGLLFIQSVPDKTSTTTYTKMWRAVGRREKMREE